MKFKILKSAKVHLGATLEIAYTDIRLGMSRNPDGSISSTILIAHAVNYRGDAWTAAIVEHDGNTSAELQNLRTGGTVKIDKLILL